MMTRYYDEAPLDEYGTPQHIISRISCAANINEFIEFQLVLISSRTSEGAKMGTHEGFASCPEIG